MSDPLTKTKVQFQSMRETKLDGMGYLLTWIRTRHDLTQMELAQKLASEDSEITSVLWLIKNSETGRQKLPLSFLKKVGRALGEADDWHTKVPKPALQAREERKQYGTTDLEVPLAPSDRHVPLRTSYVINKNGWNGRTLVPGYLVPDRYRLHRGEDQFPLPYGDVVEKGDEDVQDSLCMPGDVFIVDHELIPEPPMLVLATSKAGKAIRRQLVISDGAWVLRHFRQKLPDVRLVDVLALEGVIVARIRRFRENGLSAVGAPDGLRLEDL